MRQIFLPQKFLYLSFGTVSKIFWDTSTNPNAGPEYVFVLHLDWTWSNDLYYAFCHRQDDEDPLLDNNNNSKPHPQLEEGHEEVDEEDKGNDLYCVLMLLTSSPPSRNPPQSTPVQLAKRWDPRIFSRPWLLSIGIFLE